MIPDRSDSRVSIGHLFRYVILGVSADLLAASDVQTALADTNITSSGPHLSRRSVGRDRNLELNYGGTL